MGAGPLLVQMGKPRPRERDKVARGPKPGGLPPRSVVFQSPCPFLSQSLQGVPPSGETGRQTGDIRHCEEAAGGTGHASRDSGR